MVTHKYQQLKLNKALAHLQEPLYLDQTARSRAFPGNTRNEILKYFLGIRPVQKTAWFLVKIRHFSQNTISLNIGPNIHFNRLGNGDEVHHQVGQFCLGKRGPCVFNFLYGKWTVVLRIDWPHFSLSRTAGCALGIKENTAGSSCWSID